MHQYTVTSPKKWQEGLMDYHGQFGKQLALPLLIHLAMTVYFRGTQRECNVEQWQKMGELVLEAIYSSYCPNACFSKPQECVICTQPLFHEVTTTCGHTFHSPCLERWMFEDVTCPLCRYEL
ncbi:putative RING finger protein C548.05c like protein [Argiope bruennichi]|uniref:Putative RING finger protein C548.05c like protein n=1 Tax=Argiope bruennichi TaxID=94029 RepID=A0A8T0EGG5_ARGBR|nr:putative RING finger protein C548.05c like protein [Argiope bruennichi]